MRLTPALLLGFVLTSAVAHAQTVRDVNYGSHAVVHVNAKLRFTTMIVLPASEEILDYVCGDKDFWVVSGAHNLAYVKPAKAGATTDLNLVTASGNIYSFLLTEGTGDPDLKVFVMPDASMKAAAAASPKYYTAAEVEPLKQAADDAKKAEAAAKQAAAASIQQGINAFRAAYPTELEFPYEVKGNGQPFNVVAIYHDDRFTYIKAHATELPSLYEVRDGAPNLVNFQVEHGVYVVPKILDQGYLTIGHNTLRFTAAQ